MVKVIKYTADLTEAGAKCGVAACEKEAAKHVCFEDGSGVSVCKQCFLKNVNEGDWITDSCQSLLAS